MGTPTTTWGVGDYPAMARLLMPAAEAVVAAAGVRPDDRVLDLATGTGNAAVLAAQSGARTIGVDLEPTLLALARRRAADAGLTADWRVGDVIRLPVPDDSADVVLSVFGVMYASDHDAAARELSRVVAPSGRVALAAWTPGDFLPAMGQVLAAYLPPPPAGSVPPSRWGDRDSVGRLLEAAGLRVTSAVPQRLHLSFADGDAATSLLIDTAGHIVAERNRLVAQGRWQAMRADLRSFVDDRGVTDGDHFRLELEYLMVTATPATTAAA
ncbi:methyltransferase domain-containing protein [Micromonospora sp. STR1_7]|uniref:Methyltransferase domain-containing protein n=1 Tax=Micromonospora parastrephiae TaxID=2806101 RepID=A0ABS1XPB0_9ACTN|nr:class I SAM-dependent methyltransferase [Micromonospora parastrephiae]MBM0231104.1 methyltransferase domain-containing protein [Micromonospora parastrephiae]